MKERWDGGMWDAEMVYIYQACRVLDMETQWQDLTVEGAVVVVVDPMCE